MIRVAILALSALLISSCSQASINAGGRSLGADPKTAPAAVNQSSNAQVKEGSSPEDSSVSNTPKTEASHSITTVTNSESGETTASDPSQTTSKNTTCKPQSIFKLPSQDDLNSAPVSEGDYAIKSKVVDAGAYPRVRVIPHVARPGDIIRVVWQPHIDNCNSYRIWPTSCDPNVALCAKYAGRGVFNSFGGVSSIPLSVVPHARLLGFEVSNTEGELLYWRRADDSEANVPAFLSGDPLKINKFEAPESVGDFSIPGWIDMQKLKGDGLSEAEYRALPKCSKQNNKNFSQNMLFITVWKIDDDAVKDKPVYGSVSGGDYYGTGISSAEYTLLPGAHTSSDTCYQ